MLALYWKLHSFESPPLLETTQASNIRAPSITLHPTSLSGILYAASGMSAGIDCTRKPHA